jgi:hypothetical protein
VAEIGGEDGKQPFDIHPFAMPRQERSNGEAMPEVMHAGARVIARTPEADLAGQVPEDPMDILVQQPAAALGDEEMRAAVLARWRAKPRTSVSRRAQEAAGLAARSPKPWRASW